MNNSHPKIHIKYPPLVEQGFRIMRQHGYNIPRNTIYIRMVDAGLIDANGLPTQTAIDSGMVVVDPYYYSGGDPDPKNLADFKALHPICQQFDDSHFAYDNGRWHIDAQSVRVIAVAALESPDTPPELKARAKQLLSDTLGRFKGE